MIIWLGFVLCLDTIPYIVLSVIWCNIKIEFMLEGNFYYIALLTATNVLGIILCPVGGKVIDTYGRKNILIFATLLFLVSPFFLAFANDIYWFLGAWAFWSVPRGISYPVLGIYLTENLPTVDRGKNFILYCAFLPIGLAISAGVACLTLEDFDAGDWRYYLTVIGIIQIFFATVTFILIEPSPRFLIFNG